MKKTSRKVLSVVLAVMLLCSIMSISVFADNDPSVTVYITTGMFTEGGYNTTTNRPELQHYNSSTVPGSGNYFNSTIGKQIIKISDINVSTTKGYYGNPSVSDLEASPNVLDAIIFALTNKGYTPVGGWDSWGDGGYISYFTPDGSTYYNPNNPTQVTKNGVTYYVYTGTGWQIACTQNGSLSEIDSYGTNFGLVDGMDIVFDLSNYTIYY